MLSERKLTDLVKLVRRRYPDWESFDQPDFLADEISFKQATAAKAAESLSRSALDALLKEGDYDRLVEHLHRISQDNNLLWRQVPRAGDTAILTHPNLDLPAFCAQFRNLIHGDRPSPDRLQAYADYLARCELPNKWPFPTYFLFLCHPDEELFVKPRTIAWFLRYIGRSESIVAPPSGPVYGAIKAAAHSLREALGAYGVRDMIDVQSFIWVAAQESKARTGRLDARGQVELDVPPSRPSIPAERPAVPYAIPEAMALLREDAASSTHERELPAYSLAACSRDTGVDEARLARWVRAIRRKGQAVLYGPPGTGKTFLADKLAHHLAGGGDGLVELIQFHSAYAYEDFVQGLRPVAANTGDEAGMLRYEIVPGHFLRFCQEAQRRQGTCVLVIDELNRANVSAVFGEVMVLLEYRNREAPLAAGGHLQIPSNVLLIGTMNTADRSIALVDYALRRRFAFIQLQPDYDVLRHFHRHTGYDVAPLIRLLQQLNQAIDDPHYHLGITYFLIPEIGDHLEDVWRLEIEPYLEEFFFDQPDRVDDFRWQAIQARLRS